MSHEPRQVMPLWLTGACHTIAGAGMAALVAANCNLPIDKDQAAGLAAQYLINGGVSLLTAAGNRKNRKLQEELDAGKRRLLEMGMTLEEIEELLAKGATIQVGDDE